MNYIKNNKIDFQSARTRVHDYFTEKGIIVSGEIRRTGYRRADYD